jgi:hypothetical protein
MACPLIKKLEPYLERQLLQLIQCTTLKAFNETEKMAIARSLVSLFSAFVIFKE